MKKMKKDIFICVWLIMISILYTILIKIVDVQAIGPKKSLVGFATINSFIFDLTGVNMNWYNITDWLGLIPVAMAFIYTILGLIQMIKKRSFIKVDKEILCLGIFYLFIILLYIIFETFVVNYRPILIDGFLEASYPSSHTLLSICICGSSIMINKYLFENNRFFKFENIISILSIIIIVGGRFISGVHWFTDIIGAILISITLLKCLDIALKKIHES